MKKILIFLLMIVFLPLSSFVSKAYSAGETNEDYRSLPTFVGSAVPPLVMMLMGRDHKLYYEAYNDASDIDEDGQLDIGYKHSITYYGYFDPFKCYDYDATGTAKFVPFGITTDKFCTGANAGKWSGNFLNWLTTSRIDALRKVLYGGFRSTDNSAETVLESEYIPQDAHSWGKELTGPDTPKLTPFTDPSGSGTLPTAPVPWDTLGTSQKILLVTYDDSVSGLYGNNHTDLVNSYSVCDYSSYNYIGDFNYTGINPRNNHINTGNFFLVTEFFVSPTQGGIWSFAVDSDDGAEVEIYDTATATGTVVASWYGPHGSCCGNAACDNCRNLTSRSGTISLNANRYYRMLVRQRENWGGDGVKVWYKVPGDDTWRVFGSVTDTNSPSYVTFRAPNIINSDTGLAEVVRLKTTSFITTGEPAYDPSGTGTVTCPGGRHLFCVTSLADGATPVIRVLQNKSNRIWEWASKERPVCDTSLGVPTDYFVRVKVCDSTVGLESNCKAYPNSPPSKPIGLLQKFGENQPGASKVCSNTFLPCTTDTDCSGAPVKCMDIGQMLFGLMTGSYTKNLSGGVLRWNLDSITHAVDNKNVGIIKTASDNMIKTLNSLTTRGFAYPNSGNYYYSSNCGWITGTGLTEGKCRMWGNPIAEMMYEAQRYFAGKGAPLSIYSSGTNASGTDDRALGLPNAGEAPTADNNWTDPYLKYPSCSKPFMIVLSDVNPSYDSDQLPGVDSNFGSYTTTSADLTGINVKTLTDTIGANEGINGANAFIGQSGATTDTICSSKSVTGLGSVRGLCPEEPTKKGSYYSAGVAYYGKKDFSANNGGRPNITTYSVALISPVPEIKLDVGGKTVKIVPIGKSVSGCLNVNTACANRATLTYNAATTGLTITPTSSSMYCPSNQIVDFYIETLTSTHGNFRVNFEDVEQGADHDMDSIVQYTYDVDASAGTVTIGLNSSYAAGCIDQVLGFVITGTTEDGVYLPVRDSDSGTSDSDTPAVVAGMPTTWSKTFTASSTAPATTLLKDPLWYAAKWGGFEDQDGDNKPYTDSTCGTASPNVKCSEWDKDGNGVPDTYFLISNPLKMEQQLTQVFADILKKSASGTSVSILATSAEGEGALYQAYFYPERIMDDGSKREWLGYCRGLFLDSYGNLREDTDSNARLIFNEDSILRMRFDETTNEVRVDLYNDADEDGDADPDGDTDTVVSTVSIDAMMSIWEAGKRLALRDKDTRNIYTWIDSDNDGAVDDGDFANPGGEALLFTSGNASTLQKYLRALDSTEAANIINFTRGKPVSGYRNRCLPITEATQETGCSGSKERSWAMGDIVYSTPTVVATPKEQYDLIYGDSTYTTYRTTYAKRRNVVYAGANDGLLHAFNAGVYTGGDDPSTGGAKEHGWFIANPTSGNGWQSPTLSIGDELWAFLPYDNLPHLKWLTSSSYSHVYYMDLKPKVTDVRIFNDTATGVSGLIDGQSGVSHPHGWGTILIVGMRLGGGAIGVDLNSDGDTSDTGETLRSTYYALDITDPEKPPRLLWRFTDPTLGFTTSYPAVVHFKATGTTSERWYMVVGSGPDNNPPPDTRGYDGSSTQNGRVFIVDIKTGSLLQTFTTESSTFMGDPVVIDGDLDYNADVIYIGSVINKTSGKIYRITTNGNPDPGGTNWTLSTLFDQNAPLLSAPTASKDSLGNLWVFFGTGRYFDMSDKADSNQQRFYGIKDGCWDGSCTTQYQLTDLLNTTAVKVDTNKGSPTQVSGDTTACGGSSTCSFSQLITTVRSYRGWYIDLNNPQTPSERVLSSPVILGGIVSFTSFTPNNDICGVLGESSVYALYYETGSAYNEPVIGTETIGGKEYVRKQLSLGKGVPTTVSIAIGKETKGFVQTSTGTILEVEEEISLEKSGPASWREKEGSGGTVGIKAIYKHIVK